jgi:lipopolysaccharide/colanic/teichoic acid biosynthesis glycosyltransferase
VKPFKRAFDLFWTIPGIIILSVPFSLVVLVVWLDDHGPAFYVQERVGLYGRPFELLKFRTMVMNADKIGPTLTVSNDARITRVGRFLRHTKIDELPQLLNVLRGDMSLVGPRPEVQAYVDRYTVDQRRVLELIPGITDPASLKYRNEGDILAQSAAPDKLYLESLMPDKIRVNLEYARTANVATDFCVIIKTVFGMR